MKEIETNRLKLRKLTKDDASAIFNNWANDPDVTKYLSWNPHKNINETKNILDIWLDEYVNPKTYRWGITIKDSGELIGQIDVVSYSRDGMPVIGYLLSKRYWNNGYMTEAFSSVIKYLFEDEGFASIRIAAANNNIGSNRVIIKNGFTLFKQENQPIKIGEEEQIVNIYSLDRNK